MYFDLSMVGSLVGAAVCHTFNIRERRPLRVGYSGEGGEARPDYPCALFHRGVYDYYFSFHFVHLRYILNLLGFVFSGLPPGDAILYCDSS